MKLDHQEVPETWMVILLKREECIQESTSTEKAQESAQDLRSTLEAVGQEGGRLIECERFQASLGTNSIKTLIFSDEELMPQEGTSKAIILQLKINIFFKKRGNKTCSWPESGIWSSPQSPVLGYSYHSGSWYVFTLLDQKLTFFECTDSRIKQV